MPWVKVGIDVLLLAAVGAWVYACVWMVRHLFTEMRVANIDHYVNLFFGSTWALFLLLMLRGWMGS